jgi:hypothetical protein
MNWELKSKEVLKNKTKHNKTSRTKKPHKDEICQRDKGTTSKSQPWNNLSNKIMWY